MSFPRIARYPAGLDPLSFDIGPEGVEPRPIVLTAEDGGRAQATLWSKGTESTVVLIIHPRADVSRHYTIPPMVDAGYAVLAHQSRWPGNDATASHEVLLLDIAAAVIEARRRGFDKIVLLGYSGGGSVYSFYQAQAVAPAGGRLTDTAAGDPLDLNRFEMPPVDGIVFMSAHLGAGRTLLSEIDPSVTDESDATSVDPTLDMYDARNGFKPAPEPSSYSPEFLERYRAAQSARVTRIDAVARSLIADQRYFRSVADESGFTALREDAQAYVLRRAVKGRFLNVYRTDANPTVTDPTLFPSSRTYGSLMAIRPDLANYGDQGFAKYIAPRAWLSLWSGHSSRAAVLDNLPDVTIPTFVVCYTGDNAIYPVHAEAILEGSPAADKSIVYVDGDHFGFPLPSDPEGGRTKSMPHVVGWLTGRFPR